MLNILKIAVRNLARFHRRTWLTSTLITLGIVAVLLFIATAGSFKTMMIGQFTDGVLGQPPGPFRHGFFHEYRVEFRDPR